MDFFLHIFQNTWNFIDAPLANMATQMSARLFAYVRPNMKTILILFMSFTAASSLMRSFGDDLFQRYLPALVAAALFMTTILTVPFYQTTIIYMWQRVPAGLVAAITGGPPGGNVPTLLDTSMIKSVLGGTTILEGISTSMFNPQTWVIMIFCAALIACAIASHVVMFFGFGALDFLMALLVGFGPVALSFGTFEKTRGIAVAWLACLATSAAATGLLVATIVLIIGIEGNLAQQILSLQGGGAGAFGVQLVALGIGSAVYLLFGWLALQTRPLAEAIFNGVTGSVNGIIGAPVDAALRAKGEASPTSPPTTSGGGGPSTASASLPPGRPIGRP